MLYLFIRYFWAITGGICLGSFLWTSYNVLKKQQDFNRKAVPLLGQAVIIVFLSGISLVFALYPLFAGICAAFIILFFSLVDCFHYQMKTNSAPWWKFVDSLGYALLAVILAYISISYFYQHAFSLRFVGILIFIIFGLFLRALYRRNREFSAQRKITGYERFGQICGRIICSIYIFLILFFEIISINMLWGEITDPAGQCSDICLDTGWCKEGYVFDNCPPDGEPCIINKEVCEKDGGRWYADRKICNIRP